jgi:malate dehydrogenase (oxaloacetate-decarboxylating)(NADP+)
VAYPCQEIEKDPDASFYLTNRANSVGIFTNGTSVMGLGDIGVLAAKPAMEGQVVLMKHLGDVDALDVGVDTKDPDEFVN